MDIMNFHVVVSKQTIPYFQYQMANVRHTADDPDRIFFYCYALDQETWENFSCCPWVVKTMPVYQNVWAYRKKTLGEWITFLTWLFLRKPRLVGSNGHAAGLAGMARTMEHIVGHHIVADVDTIMLQKNWDTKLIRMFEEYDLMGAPYEPIGGFSSGSAKVQTYKDFPTAVWVALKAGQPWQEMNWWPEKEANITINSKELSETYNLPEGYEVVRDVGWHLCPFAYERGLPALAFEHVKPSSSRVKVLKTDTDYNEEYQHEGDAWVGHQRGSSRNPFRQSDLSVNFFNAVENAVGIPTPMNWAVPEMRFASRVKRFVKSRLRSSGNG